MLEIVCATANAHKVTELETLLGAVVRLVPRPSTLGEVDETADTLEGNALLKARAVSAHTALVALADDTGLEVDALAGRPGVHSARFAGNDADDAQNRAKLLTDLVEVTTRSARFRTVLALVYPDGRELLVEGLCDGSIAHEERGVMGFGYDSIFIPDDGDGRTFAEMGPEAKNVISHRSRAINSLRSVLSTR
ncbi:MAG: RdgB/HAM1 family non-canonical purine NTP pyrophosphatase [Ilumatobacteraceae bacterium]|jgi:XTP/dITP diphosphohydrolase|nr:RdgB/HAM1 family non-canonical purine NTP pyrophosphatase [Ilumatobacteraceae bacterium]